MRFGIRALLALALLISPAYAATLLPPGENTFIDANGAPLAAGTVTFFIPGTSTLKNTWRDSGQVTLNTNPVVLDAAGRAIIYGSGAYRQIVKDSLGNTVWDQITSDTSASSNSWAATSGGSANAQTVSASNFTSGDGQSISFIAKFSNNAAFTLNPNGTGPIAVNKDTAAGPVAFTGGEIIANNQYTVVYDATAGFFHLVAVTASATPSFTSLTVTGATTLAGSVVISGTISPGALASNTNDWSPTSFATATVVRMSASAAVNVTGLLARTGGTVVVLQNIGSFNITLTAQDGSSAAANRFQFQAPEVIQPNQSILIQYDGTTAAWRLAQKTPSLITPFTVRQTVETGPTDATGLPNFLPATAVALTLTSQNLNTTQLVIDSAAGFGASGAIDNVCTVAANQSWGPVTASQTNYLFETVTNSVCTTGFTVTPPIYQRGGTISVSAGQYTFDIAAMQMYLGNGATAPAVNVVFVGEAVASGSAITSTAAYAYQGYYQYDDTSSLPTTNTAITKAHNIGTTYGLNIEFGVVNAITEGSYAVGDYATTLGTQPSGAISPFSVAANRLNVFTRTGATGAWFLISNANGSQLTLTAADWRYRFKVKRNW